jgi:hypothetical protein
VSPRSALLCRSFCFCSFQRGQKLQR